MSLNNFGTVVTLVTMEFTTKFLNNQDPKNLQQLCALFAVESLKFNVVIS
jgi:hypothetical protein